jgi:hypothetical protein
MQKLQGCAATSVEKSTIVHALLERFKTISERHVGGSTKFTTWIDIDHMLQHTNHYTKNRSGNVDWNLEMEEGYVLYNIFFAHFSDRNKEVIHICNFGTKFLNNNCSLCQGHFGLKGAIILGQCHHAFHVTCIAEHSLR